MYNPKDIPVKNQLSSVAFDPQSEKVICLTNGEVKIINCDFAILKETLSYIDSLTTFETIESNFLERYSLSEIQSFLQTLLAEQLITLPNTPEPFSRVTTPKILVIGESPLGQLVTKSPHLNSVHLSLECFLQDDTLCDFDIAVLAPEEVTYADILLLNQRLVKINIPFMLTAFNGSEVTVGPLTVPGKNACLECWFLNEFRRVEQRLDSESELTASNISSLLYSHKFTADFSEGRLSFLGELVADEVVNLVSGKPLQFIDTQYFYSTTSVGHTEKVVHYPNTRCTCCAGINKGFHILGEKEIIPPKGNVLPISDSIRYNTGGLRSKSESEASDIVRGALARLNMGITIERAEKNPFNEIIPCYNAVLENHTDSKSFAYLRKDKAWGKGLSEKQSYFSAAFELFEHLGRQYTGNVPILSAEYSRVKNMSIDLEEICQTIQNPHTDYDKFQADTQMDFVWARSLSTGEQKLVPAFLTFMNDVKVRGRFFGTSSSGVAAASTIEDAILHGLFEVIEHDAWMIGQANPYIMPLVDYTTSKNEKLLGVIEKIKSRGFDVICRDYTTDLGIPVFRTWIVNQNNYTHYAFSGFGCSVSPEIALERSITEAVQSDNILDPLNPINNLVSQKELKSNPNAINNLSYFSRKDLWDKTDKVTSISAPVVELHNVSQVITDTVSHIQKRMPGCDVLYVDLTKEQIQIPTVRVIVTGEIQRLNFPLLSVSPRMFDFGIKMGYASDKSRYEDLYLGDYPS